MGSFSIYKSNINNLIWSIPIASGVTPKRRQEIRAICDNSRRIHIFGGNANFLEGSNLTYFNDMVDFNIVSSSWSDNNVMVKGRSSYSATLLPSGVIVYIGGYELNENTQNSTSTVMSDISLIYLYDTNSLTWSNMVCMNS